LGAGFSFFSCVEELSAGFWSAGGFCAPSAKLENKLRAKAAIAPTRAHDDLALLLRAGCVFSKQVSPPSF
jgi:hypothetical protein